MTESQQVRLQKDIVKEIKQHDGGSFSEKFRNWKQAKIDQRIGDLASSDDLLTEFDVREILREELPEILRDMQRG